MMAHIIPHFYPLCFNPNQTNIILVPFFTSFCDNSLMDRRQILLLILAEFKGIN